MEPSHKRSREKRSSKRSLRSSAGSSIDAGKFEVSSAVAERRLQMILEDEQQELVIYSVREELMQRVMEECHKKYMEKQCVEFTVHCAYRALAQVVNLGLFHHDPGKPFYKDHPSWLDDKPPEPSPADSWAVSQVAIRRKPIPKPFTPAPDEDTFKHVAVEELENVFTGIERPKQESASVVDVEVIYKSQHVEAAGELESELQLPGPPGTEVSLTVEEQNISIGSVHPLSIFTQTTEMPREYLPHSMKSARSKIKGLVTKMTEHPTLNMDEISCAKSKLSVGVLPPLRSNMKYKEKIQTIEDDKRLDDMPSDT